MGFHRITFLFLSSNGVWLGKPWVACDLGKHIPSDPKTHNQLIKLQLIPLLLM